MCTVEEEEQQLLGTENRLPRQRGRLDLEVR